MRGSRAAAWSWMTSLDCAIRQQYDLKLNHEDAATAISKHDLVGSTVANESFSERPSEFTSLSQVYTYIMNEYS
jgi:hypothetical protein